MGSANLSSQRDRAASTVLAGSELRGSEGMSLFARKL